MNISFKTSPALYTKPENLTSSKTIKFTKDPNKADAKDKKLALEKFIKSKESKKTL